MHHFTPYTALIGGTLIGLSAVLLLWLNGQIAGISGIVNGALSPQKNDTSWRILFLVGLILGGFVYHINTYIHFIPRTGFPMPLLILAGFLVGFGTRLGSGCTSGHGVCGIGRISKRSIVATFLFLGSGMITVYVTRHVLGIQ